jgi:hypothetical protein
VATTQSPRDTALLRSMAEELVRESRRLIAETRWTRELTRQTRAGSHVVRSGQAVPRCPICLWTFPPGQRGYLGAYVLEGDWAASARALLHPRCLGRWLADRMSTPN